MAFKLSLEMGQEQREQGAGRGEHGLSWEAWAES